MGCCALTNATNYDSLLFIIYTGKQTSHWPSFKFWISICIKHCKRDLHINDCNY